MLTRPARQALPPSARAVPGGTLVAVAALAATPTLLTVARHGTDLTLALSAAAVVGGAGLAFALDDEAETVVAASPTPLAVRRAVRLAVAAAVVGVAWAVAALTAAAGTAPLDARSLRGPAVEAAAAAGLALALAAWARRRGGDDHTALGAAAGAVLAMLLVTALAPRYPQLPSLGGGPNHHRWVVLAIAGWAAFARHSRDPARR